MKKVLFLFIFYSAVKCYMYVAQTGEGVLTAPVYEVRGISVLSNYPGWQNHAAASWVINNGAFWLFGLQGQKRNKNDLWKYNIATNVHTSGNGSLIAVQEQISKQQVKSILIPLTERKFHS